MKKKSKQRYAKAWFIEFDEDGKKTKGFYV